MASHETLRQASTAMTTGLLFALAILSATSAAAQDAGCVDSADIAPLLEQNFGETAAWVCLLPNSNVVEIYHNPDSESWTVAVRVPETEKSCVVATGNGQSSLDYLLGVLDTK